MCFINRLFICLSVYSLTYCLLLVVNSFWRRQSCPSRAAAAVELRVRRSVMGFVCIVWQNGRRLLLGAYKWEDYLSWTCCLHTCVYVILWKSVHAWAFSNHSDLSTVRSTQPHECTQRAGAPHQPGFYLSSFRPCASFTNHKKILYPFPFSSSFSPSRSFHRFSPTLSLLLLCHHYPCSPPSLTPQLGSTIRLQWQCSAWCVCDVTPQRLYSSTLFF